METFHSLELVSSSIQETSEARKKGNKEILRPVLHEDRRNDIATFREEVNAVN